MTRRKLSWTAPCPNCGDEIRYSRGYLYGEKKKEEESPAPPPPKLTIKDRLKPIKRKIHNAFITFCVYFTVSVLMLSLIYVFIKDIKPEFSLGI
jgi:hypothetical protein